MSTNILTDEPSVAPHEALDFRRMGEVDAVGCKNAEWHDSSLWQRPIAEPSPYPQSPLEVREEQYTPGWHKAMRRCEDKLRLGARS